MKTFKSLADFEKRLKKGMDWGDWIKINGKVYKMVEYGEGENGDYMSFQNKRTSHMLQVNYDCPSSQNGIKIKDYRFRGLEDLGRLGYLYRY
jgi:hypothetical protein